MLLRSSCFPTDWEGLTPRAILLVAFIHGFFTFLSLQLLLFLRGEDIILSLPRLEVSCSRKLKQDMFGLLAQEEQLDVSTVGSAWVYFER